MDRIRDAIAEDASGVVRSVLERWTRIVEQEPWWTTGHVDADHLTELVESTADAALADHLEETETILFVRTAMEHGRDRRRDGHRDTVIHQEFLLLRRALRECLRERFGASEATHRATTRLDGALSHAEIASLYGFHEHDLPGDNALRAPERLSREWLRQREGWPG